MLLLQRRSPKCLSQVIAGPGPAVGYTHSPVPPSLPPSLPPAHLNSCSLSATHQSESTPSTHRKAYSLGDILEAGQGKGSSAPTPDSPRNAQHGQAATRQGQWLAARAANNQKINNQRPFNEGRTVTLRTLDLGQTENIDRTKAAEPSHPVPRGCAPALKALAPHRHTHTRRQSHRNAFPTPEA